MIVGDLMTRDVPCLHSRDTLEKAVRLLRKTKLDGLPVVDQTDRLVGIFTKANMMDAYLAEVEKTAYLEQYFNREVVTVDVSTDLSEFEGIVKNSPVGTGVVINKQRDILGVFTKVDMIMALFKEAEQLVSRLNTVYNGMHNGIIVVDNRNCIQLINSAGEKMLGLEEQIIKGCSFTGIFPNIDLTPVFAESHLIVGVKEKLNGIKTLCNISPIVQDTGVAGAIIIFQALTDLDQVASELEATKRLYETLLTVLNIAYEAIIVIDDKGKIVLVNEAACNFFDKRESLLLNKPVDQVIENTMLPRTLKTGMSETNEVQVIGGRTYIVSRMPIIRAGKVIGAVGKIIYQRLEEVKVVAEKLAQMEHELTYYMEKAGQVPNIVTFDHIITINKAMCKLKQEAELVARGTSTVMLNGESGTGKELFAEAIHNASPRRRGPYVKVNCAAIPENLLESEFFGYAPGAFTGAQKDGKLGKFAAADGGTLFLDEIGDMSPNLQSKLLRVLESKCFEPVGSNRTIHVDIRVIAATNQDLLCKVEEREFRSDLYYRLNVVNFKLLPLRDRSEDIIPLVQVLLEKLNLNFGIAIQDVSEEVRYVLSAHTWPGNVRELKNVIERAVNFSTGPILQVQSLPAYLVEGLDRNKPFQFKKILARASSEDLPLDKETILRILHKVKGNKSEAAKELGISRSWLYEKMRWYDIF